MAQTLINQSQAVQDKDGYAGYNFRMEVIMNSYNSTNATYNVTINHYAKGDTATNHKYHGLITPKSTITAVANGSTIVNQATIVGQITGSEVLVATWTGTIQANSDGNLTVAYSANYNANKSSGYLPKTNTISSTIAMPTIPRYASFTSFNVNRRDETSLNVTWSTDVACDAVQYRIKASGGSYGGWVNASGTNFNIGSLSPNTTYYIQLNVRRTDSQLWTTSGEKSGLTYAYPHCTASPNFVIGNGVTLTFYNDLNRTFTATILGVNDAVLATYTGNATSVPMPNTTSEINAQYQSVANVSGGSSTYKVQVTYGSNTHTRNNGNTYGVDVNSNKPTFENFTSQYTANLTNLTNNNQTVINNLSTITFKINANATAKNYATISKYVVSWGNATPQTITNIANSVNLANGSGNTIQVTAYDSRNISDTKNITISELVPYTAPANLNVKLHRRNGIETTSYMDLTGTIYYDKFGANGVSNQVTSIKYTVNNGSTEYTISDISGITYSSQSATTHTQTFTIKNMPIHANGSSGGFDVNNAFTITAIVIDTSGTRKTIVGTLKDGKFADDWFQDDNGDYHYGVNGLAVSDYTLKVYGDISANNISGLSSYPVGSVYLSYKSTSPASLFGGTWERLRDAYLYATNADSGDKGTRDGTGKITGQATGNTGSTAISVEQMPAHTHYMHTNGEHQHNMNMNSSTVAKGSNYARPRGWGEATEVGYTTSPAGGHKHSLDNTGGGQGHTHTLNSHTHTIANIEIYAWRRTA